VGTASALIENHRRASVTCSIHRIPYPRHVFGPAHTAGNRDEHHNAAGVYAAHDPNGGDDNSIGDLEDDELTRDKVKRASAQILAAMDKKKKRPKKKTGAMASIGEDDQSVGSRPK
jgi:hypothetical protein